LVNKLVLLLTSGLTSKFKTIHIMFKLSFAVLSFLLNVENGLSYVPSAKLSSQQQQRCIQNKLPFVLQNIDRKSSSFVLKSTEEAAVDESKAEEAAADESEAEESSDEEVSAEAEEESNIMKLYLGSLPTNYDHTEIREMLEPYCADESTIASISVPTDRMTGLPRGFAFIEMESEAGAKAIEGLAGTEIDGKTIRINEQLSKEELLAKRAAAAAEREKNEVGTKIYCGNISFETSQETLEEEFAKYGNVLDVYLPVDTRTGFKRGFAFIRMENEDEAKAAIENMNGTNLEGRTVEVNISLPRGQAPPKRRRVRYEPRTKIYVGNLPFDTTTDSLSTIFYNYGSVLDCYLPTDMDTGNSRGFGFVTMLAEEAQRAIEELDGIEFDGRELRINEAQPKQRRYEPEDEEY